MYKASQANAAPSAQPGWRVSEDRSAMDDSREVTMILDADSTVRTGRGERRPVLVIRCKENETDLYIVNDASADVEYGLNDQATVRIRVDSAKAVTQIWNESTSGESLFAPSPIATAKKLYGANKLTYQFTPFDASPATTTFTLSGIRDHLPKVAATCGWKI